MVVLAAVAAGLFSAMPDPYDMFTRFPRTGRATLPVHGQVDLPYHNYESDTLLIHGWVDPAAVKAKLPSGFHPVINTKNGKSIATFWVVDYKNTSVNAYKELVVVYTVADVPRTVSCDTIHCANVINVMPGVRQYIDKLWLDETLPIEYGRVLLGCDKHKAGIKIERTGNTLSFDFKDDKEGDSLLGGSLNLDPGLLAGYVLHLPYLIWEMGLVKATFFVLNPTEFIRWAATGPPGVATGLVPAVPLEASPLWGAIFVTAPRFTWAAPGDKVVMGERFASLKFEPVLYQHDQNLMAVLLGAWGHTRHP